MKVTIENNQIPEILNALTALDKPTEGEKHYQFKDSSNTRHQIIRSLKKVKQYHADLEEARVATVRQYIDKQTELGDEKAKEVTDPGLRAEMQEDLEKLFKKKVERVFYQFKLSNLDIGDKNQIPAERVAPLLDVVIIDDLVKKEDQEEPQETNSE